MKGLFIDDKDAESQLARVLTNATRGAIDFEFRRPELELTMLADAIWAAEVQVLALDYRLDEQQSGPDPKNKYRAGALAQLLRERAMEQPAKDIPIVLVSVEENVRKFYRPDLTAHDLFDRTYTKSQVIHESIGREITSLAGDYPKLNVFLHDKNLVTLLALEKADASFVEDEEITEIAKLSAPHQLSRRIFELLIDRPGRLLRHVDLLARLGIAKDSPDLPKLYEIFRDAGILYKGVLCDGWERWWEHRLRLWGKNTFQVELGNEVGSARVKMLNDKLGLTLKPAVSRWTNSPDAKFAIACSSCESATEIQFSLAAVDRTRYKIVERKRICWACVQSGEYEEVGRVSGDELRVDSSAALIERKIKSGAIKHA